MAKSYLRQPGGGRTSTSASKTDTPTVTMEDWPETPILPSLLVTGDTGTGKTDAIAKLADVGFKVGVLVVEDKTASLARQRGNMKRIDVNQIVEVGGKRRPPTATERYARLQQFVEQLRAGAFTGVDIIATDGMTEVSDIIEGATAPKFTSQEAMKMWRKVAKDTVAFFKALRDAAGEASARYGVPPVGIVATCAQADKVKMNVKAGTEEVRANVFLMQGNEAKLRMPFAFEVMWHLKAKGGVFEIHTVSDDDEHGEWKAKSPGGLFSNVETGPGGIDGDPHVGRMYKKLLTDEASPYYNDAWVKKFESAS